MPKFLAISNILLSTCRVLYDAIMWKKGIDALEAAATLEIFLCGEKWLYHSFGLAGNV